MLANKHSNARALLSVSTHPWLDWGRMSSTGLICNILQIKAISDYLSGDKKAHATNSLHKESAASRHQRRPEEANNKTRLRKQAKEGRNGAGTAHALGVEAVD